jgi:hypothetical protein
LGLVIGVIVLAGTGLFAIHYRPRRAAEAMQKLVGDGSAQRAQLIERMSEALSFILLSAQDAWSSRDAEDRDVLLVLTADRGELMKQLRRGGGGAAADAEESAVIRTARRSSSERGAPDRPDTRLSRDSRRGTGRFRGR